MTASTFEKRCESGASAARRTLERMARRLRRLGRAVARRRRLARDGRALTAMGDRDLRDLGIRRDDIRRIVRY